LSKEQGNCLFLTFHWNPSAQQAGLRPHSTDFWWHVSSRFTMGNDISFPD